MKSDFSKQKEKIIFGNDSIVIVKFISGIEGGRTLDLTDYSGEAIPAGHVIITDGNGTYKPMPVDSDVYGTLPDGYSYAGVLYRSVSAERPEASIMTWGKVNSECVPYSMDTIKDAFKAACPYIDFVYGEEA